MPANSDELSTCVDVVESANGASDSLQSVVAAGSPCVEICQLDSDFVCIGCGRTIDEVLKWPQYTDEQKKAVLDQIFGEK